MARRRVIVISGHSYREISGIATGSAINPGSLCKMSGTGEGWAKNTVAGGSLFPIAIARNETEKEGAEITDAILQNSTFTLVLPCPGTEVQVRCVDTVVRGSLLTPDNNGGVKLRTAETAEAIVGVATGPNSDGFVNMIVGGAQALDLSV